MKRLHDMYGCSKFISKSVIVLVILATVRVPAIYSSTPNAQEDDHPNSEPAAILSTPISGVANDSTTTATSNISTASPDVHTTAAPPDDQLPDNGSSQKEHSQSLSVFLIFVVLICCILVVHLLIKFKFHYLPESVAIVCLGVFIGLISLLLKKVSSYDLTSAEILDPNTFFLILLPPIIFESGYSLHKGNFFQNLGSILVFAVFGTIISAVVVGSGVYFIGMAGVSVEFTLVESFAFGSLISAVDPVATLAIFRALDVPPLLNMLVFGESILNDAVSIVMSNTVISLNDADADLTASGMLWQFIIAFCLMFFGSAAVGILSGLASALTVISLNDADADLTAAGMLWQFIIAFCLMFFGSAAVGILSGLASALLLKHVDLRSTPSLELGTMLIFSYLPYFLSEGVELSGIMAVLFTGITMSHYTHFNLSPVVQITVQQTFRSLAFMAETCVFAYLGLAIPTFNHRFESALVVWSIILILIGRALNIFPLAFLCNKFRDSKITPKMQFVMWFSGLRGAIAYALSLHLELSDEKRHVLVTTTLTIVLFTVLGLGGSTMPLLKCIGAESTKRKKNLTLSKTEEIGSAVDAEHLSELTEEEYEANFIKPQMTGFIGFDTKYFIPFFTRRFTEKELRDGHIQMRHLTNQWYQEVNRGPPSETDEEL